MMTLNGTAIMLLPRLCMLSVLAAVTKRFISLAKLEKSNLCLNEPCAESEQQLTGKCGSGPRTRTLAPDLPVASATIVISLH